jgi:hypothetical protein
MHVAAAQPQHFGPAQPGPRHQQHDQPVPRRAARPEHRDDVSISGPAHWPFRLVQPVPGPHPPRHPRVLAPGGFRQIPVIGQLVKL